MARLPSLTALRAFEAAARLQSMTRAADELCVTHGAISRQIQVLEADVGITLLRRMPRTLVTTREGAKLAATLSAAFGLIRDGISQLQPGPVVLSCSASIMMRWLIPRLPTLAEIHPEIDLQLSANHGDIDLVREGVNLAIRNNVIAVPAGVEAKPMLNEWIGPVCSVDYAHRVGIETPADLARTNLLATKTRPKAWQDWSEVAGVDLPSEEPKNIFDHFYMLLQATSFGLGIAVSPRLLVEDDLASGRLIAPFGFVEGHRKLMLWRAPDESSRADVNLVQQWLERQAAVSAQGGLQRPD